MSCEIVRTQDLARDAAEFILACARDAFANRGEFRVALSGGNTPRPVYQQWAELGRGLPWDKILFTFGDERCVAAEDKESNYRMARDTLFLPAAVPEKSIMRMRGEIDPDRAAQEYENDLARLASDRKEAAYQHDLILLGLGDDGHTASLFPDTAALNETERSVVANYVQKLESWRVTFTFPMINRARHVCFLLSANKDPQLVQQVWNGDPRYPASRVNPTSGRLTWILEQHA